MDSFEAFLAEMPSGTHKTALIEVAQTAHACYKWVYVRGLKADVRDILTMTSLVIDREEILNERAEMLEAEAER